MAELLVDTISFTPKILENSSGNGRLVVEGVFQKSDVKNANGRIYPRKLWENVLKDRNILECLETKRMLGNVDHPADSTPRLKGASHIITFLEMMQDGTVIGKAEILETEDGKLIKELLEAGVPVGISSRAKGSLTKGPDGTFIVQESDFKLLTFDFVAAPSTPGAYPKVISESTENEEIKEIQENYMSAREKLNYLEQKAATVLCLKSNDLNESTKPFVDNTIADLVIELTKLSSEAPELRGLTESLIHNLNTKRNGIKFDLVEEFPFQKKDDESDDEDEDDDEDKKKDKDKKKKKKKVEEDTQGSADQGFVRTVPMEPPPPPGEGWAINPGDAGVLADINNSVNNFMEGREDESDVDEDTRVQALTNIALTLVQLQETENNAVARAFAAAYLVEHDRRTTENQAYSRVVEKLQEKIEEGAKTGKIVLSEDSDLRANYDKLVETFDELNTRHRLLAAKVYALQELDKAGLKDNNSARKIIAEAIQRSPTKKSIDEAIMGMASVKGMRQEKKEQLTESVQNIEGSVAKLNESNSVSDYGLSLAKKLSKSLSYSRAS